MNAKLLKESYSKPQLPFALIFVALMWFTAMIQKKHFLQTNVKN